MDDLPPEDLKWLSELDQKKFMSPDAMPEAVRRRLISLGLVKKFIDGIVLTDDGRNLTSPRFPPDKLTLLLLALWFCAFSSVAISAFVTGEIGLRRTYLHGERAYLLGCSVLILACYPVS